MNVDSNIKLIMKRDFDVLNNKIIESKYKMHWLNLNSLTLGIWIGARQIATRIFHFNTSTPICASANKIGIYYFSAGEFRQIYTIPIPRGGSGKNSN